MNLHKLQTLAVLIIVMLTTSCTSTKKFNQLSQEKLATEEALVDLNSKLQTLEKQQQKQIEWYVERDSSFNEWFIVLQNRLEDTRKELTSEIISKQNRFDEIYGKVSNTLEKPEQSGLAVQQNQLQVYAPLDDIIYYATGKTKIAQNHQANLDELATALIARPDFKLQIIGHADEQAVASGGKFRDNWDISYERAKNVVNQLVEKGVQPSQVSIVAEGEFVPRNTENGTADNAEASDRRTEFALLTSMDGLYFSLKELKKQTDLEIEERQKAIKASNNETPNSIGGGNK